MAESAEERLIRIETKLDMVFERMKDGEVKFADLRDEIGKIKTEINAIKTEMAYWKGGLALIAFVWPVIIKIFFS